MIEGRTRYQELVELHVGAVLGLVRYIIAKIADESIEIAARAVALFAPLPNAINMYQVAIGELGWGIPSAMAFAITLEIVVFLLVEIALKMWDGYLANKKRYQGPLIVSLIVVVVAVVVVMRIVFVLETYKIMALLPVVSLCSFVGIGLKRWNEYGQTKSQAVVVPEVQTNDSTIERRNRLADYIHEHGYQSMDVAANNLGYSKTIIRNDLLWLEKQQIVDIDRTNKQWAVQTNGQYEVMA